MKSKLLFWFFFIVLLVWSYYGFKYFFSEIFPSNWNKNIFLSLVAIILFWLIALSLSGYLSEKLTKYSLKKGVLFTATMIAIPISVFSLMYLYEYRERELDVVISPHAEGFESISFYGDYEWRTDEKDNFDELNEFLGQYRVEKMKDDEWNSDVSNEKGIHFNIISNTHLSASIYEERIHLYPEGYFKVLNGPIDIDWVRNYIEEYRP
ncbi:hypothetical protein CEY16_13990 [Halalkalibacillus sediminis]|uniref:Uncharacterized protein n=1 Tax=Halalkalibacillus sediminis TaxID=2018042 RepID=A0A2I0QRF2_9BACI|nr:hypothetical protein [Halalkalibacillus sediminis]PKR76912.1 hypothetical protein CEY16_13990 [Halalkalibacillus sediminis]